MLFRELGPLVKLWMTFNEPLSICELGYSQGVFAPGIKGGPPGQYKCGHNLLLAHAKAYRLYRAKYAKAQGGKISMALDGKWGFPYTNATAGEWWGEGVWGARGGRGVDAFARRHLRRPGAGRRRRRRGAEQLTASLHPSPSPTTTPTTTPAPNQPPTDVEAAQRWVEFSYAWMADPAYFGDYPASMRAAMGAALPTFTPEESALLKGSMDYFGVNFYCGYFIKAPAPGATFPFELSYKGPDGRLVGEPSDSFWLFRTPTGMRKTLAWLDGRYSVGGRKVEFTISENGASGPEEDLKSVPEVLHDAYRIRYYSSYIDNLCQAVTQDKVRLTTYWAWSLWDNFEWRQAYTERFGMIYVDLNDNLKRIPKASALWFQKYFWGVSGRFGADYYAGRFKLRPADLKAVQAAFVNRVWGS